MEDEHEDDSSSEAKEEPPILPPEAAKAGYKISWSNNKARMRARIGGFWRNLEAMLGFKNLIPRRKEKKYIESCGGKKRYYLKENRKWGFKWFLLLFGRI